MRRVSIGMIFLLLMAVAAALSPAVLAADNTATTELIKSGEYEGIVIWCGSEHVIVKQGGSQLKIELEAGTENSYQVRDNTGIPMADRYFYYNKWDIIFERKDKNDLSAAYSSTITVTVPDGVDSLLLRSESGSIQADGMNGQWLNVESESGVVSLSDTGAECVEVRSDGPVTLANVTVKDEVTIRSDGLIALENVTAAAGVTINRKAYTATGDVCNISVEGWK